MSHNLANEIKKNNNNKYNGSKGQEASQIDNKLSSIGLHSWNHHPISNPSISHRLKQSKKGEEGKHSEGILNTNTSKKI